MGNSKKEVRMDFKIVMITMLKELNKRENLAGKKNS